MSEHVQRAEPNSLNYYILVISLLCAFGVYVFEMYKRPRTLYVEATPKSAQLYIENDLVCENLPCEITMQYWPKAVWVRENKYYSQQIPISLFKHFTSERNSYEINLKAFPERPPEPNMMPEKETRSVPQQIDVPKREHRTPRSVPKSKPIISLPIECRETEKERRQTQNRKAVLCYYENDKAVTLNASGECYASYWVSVTGRVKNIQGFGCMHEALMKPAKYAFENRIYLPALKNGKPVESAVDDEIKYGSNIRFSVVPETESRSVKTINGDARVLSCPPISPPKNLKRSGHCIFEFDLTSTGGISKLREIKCTDAVLKLVTSTSFYECAFKPAITDGAEIERLYMKHQIDVDVYDAKGKKVPLHASFGEKNINKPYVVYE